MFPDLDVPLMINFASCTLKDLKKNNAGWYLPFSYLWPPMAFD